MADLTSGRVSDALTDAEELTEAQEMEAQYEETPVGVTIPTDTVDNTYYGENGQEYITPTVEVATGTLDNFGR